MRIVRSLHVRHSFPLYSYSLIVYPSFFVVLVYLVFRLAFFVVFVEPMKAVFVRVSSCRTGRANGERRSLSVFRIRGRFRVIVSSPLGPVIVIKSFSFFVFVSFIFVSHVIGHIDASTEVWPPVSFVIVITSRSFGALAIVFVVSLRTVGVTLLRSFETWIRIHKYRFRVSLGRSSIVRYVVSLIRSRSRAFSSFACEVDSSLPFFG